MPWAERQRAMLGEMGLGAALPPALPPAPLPRVGAAAGPASGLGGKGLQRAPAGAAAPSSPSSLRGDAGPAERAPGRSTESLAAGAPPPAPAPRRAAGSDAGPAVAGTTPISFVARPAASAYEAVGWPQLRHAVADCTACELCQTRKQTVFGVGHPRAHWMVVGEAPGAQEDEQGEPFVGPAGQLLDAMLRALQLSRSAEGEPARSVYIANTLKCRPPGNRNPQPEEMARCEPFLVRQIELVQPRIILAMGRFAVSSLLRSNEPIGKLRGRVHEYRGVPLVVTYHPAYLLRNLPDKARAWEDLCLAASQLER
jgi:uracil-DNA glycosylase